MGGTTRLACALLLCVPVAGCGWFGGSDGPGGAGGGIAGAGGQEAGGTGGGGAGGMAMGCSERTDYDVSAPELLWSDPEADASVVWTSWLTLRFQEELDRDVLETFSLCCGDIGLPLSAHLLGADGSAVVINPSQDLPFEARCALSWPGPSGVDTLSFDVSQSLPEAVVFYDRSDPSRYAPFPDDAWLTPDATTATGARVELPVPARDPLVRFLFGQLRSTAGMPDGFSPIGGLVVELSEAPLESSLPGSGDDSLDPLATVGLYDLEPTSPSYLERVPFQLYPRSVSTTSAPDHYQHALVLYPSIPLAPDHRYALVVTRRALSMRAQPYDPSAFMRQALERTPSDELEGLDDVRPLVQEVMSALVAASPPVFEDDVALVLRFSTRSTEALTTAPLAMKAQVLAAPPPAFQITSTTAGAGDVAAIVQGTWNAPEWREGLYLSPGPVVVETKSIPFTLAIPRSAETEPAPVVMYQHGDNSTAEKAVPRQAEGSLAGAGFAVIGFSDTATRELGDDKEAQVLAMFQEALLSGRLPDYYLQATGEQLSMLRLIQELSLLDEVPFPSGDGQADLDVMAPLGYVGTSEGANKAQALAPYAPEIAAAALVVGGARLMEASFVFDEVGPDGVGTTLLNALAEFAPSLAALDLYVGLSILQMGFDPQDGHNHAAFMYREPLEVAGTFKKPSMLLIEGIGDSRVPNNATRSLAYTLGLVPQLDPIVPVSYLPEERGTLTGNIDAGTTAAHLQYVPAGTPGTEPSAGCEMEREGHFCAQIASDSVAARVSFLRSSVENGVATIAPP